MPKYLVIHPVDHDGVRHEPEAILTVSEAVAAPLLAVGAVVEADAAAARRAKAAKAAEEQAAADLAAKRAELQRQIDVATAAMVDADSDERLAELQQQIDAATSELATLG